MVPRESFLPCPYSLFPRWVSSPFTLFQLVTKQWNTSKIYGACGGTKIHSISVYLLTKNTSYYFSLPSVAGKERDFSFLIPIKFQFTLEISVYCSPFCVNAHLCSHGTLIIIQFTFCDFSLPCILIWIRSGSLRIVWIIFNYIYITEFSRNFKLKTEIWTTEISQG